MDVKELKKRKKALKLTTAELAFIAELPVGTVSKIMTGETKNPSYATIEKIDKALAHEEMLARVHAYIEELLAYIHGHPDENVDQVKFEREYRKAHNLDDSPLPFAMPQTAQNNALDIELFHDPRVNEEICAQLGENRCIELIDGHLIINEMPDMDHQIIVQNLGEKIRDFIKRNKGKCKMFNVGINVFLDEDDYTLVIPDVVVLCDRGKIGKKGIIGAPDWVIEVVSPSTRTNDYNRKMHKYMAAGVREYWIIDPLKEKIITYVEGETLMACVYDFTDHVPVYIYDGRLQICMSEL